MAYTPALALTIISGVFLALGAVFGIIVAIDILVRQGWKSMMLIMIPVYIINATYMGPLALYLYYRFGRPTKPVKGQPSGPSCHDTSKQMSSQDEEKDDGSDVRNGESPGENHAGHDHDMQHGDQGESGGHEHMHHGGDRPFWATVGIGVMHCGAGCVLGDIVGEWLVFGTDVRIHGRHIWPELLIDYGFALLFGIVFQYFSIAPMSGDYGPKTIIRAAKADILSLTSFELGLFGWMVAYQVGIWDYQLPIDTWTYWWQMQVGMFFGYFTAFPVNWWLIKQGIKEPCA